MVCGRLRQAELGGQVAERCIRVSQPLHDLQPPTVAEGAADPKVLHVGISGSPAWIASQAHTLAALRGWSPFVALQVPYSVAGREPERELLPMAAALGLAVTPWGVLEAGTLTGKPKEERRWPDDAVSSTAQQVIAILQRIAEARGATTAQVAIAWLLQQPGPPALVPIIAARRPEQIRENLGAREVGLDPEEIAELEAAGRPALGFPRNFLESQGVRELIYGSTFKRIRS